MKPPRVSVVMPIYKVERFIDAAIGSVLTQRFDDFELIGVDDASPDDSAGRFLRHRDTRLRLVRHASNLGLAAARNTGIDAACGDYVALLDSDDMATPDRLERQVALLDANRQIDLCGGHMRPVALDGRACGRLQRAETRGDRIRATLMVRNCFFVSSVTMRRALARQVRFSTDMAMAEDYEFYARAATVGGLANLDATLLWYRMNPAGLTATRPAAMAQAVELIQRRQLEALGLAPTARSLALNRHLGDLHLAPDETVLGEIEAWIDRLADLRQLPTSREAWRGTLADHWFEACSHASGLGSIAWRRFCAHPLRPYVGVPAARIASFALKASVGLRRGQGLLRLVR